MEKNHINAFKARVESNSIIFYFNGNSKNGFKGYLDTSNNIQKERIIDNVPEFFDLEIMSLKNIFQSFKAMFLYVILLLSSIILSICTSNTFPTFIFLYFFAFVWVKCAWAIISYKNRRFGNKKEQLKARLHGAAHKTINAYNALNRVPTIEEIKKFSIFSQYCDSKRLLNYSIIFFVLIMIMPLEEFNIISQNISLLITLFFCAIILFKIDLFNFTQWLIVEEPTETELNVALRALECLEDYKVFHKEL